MKRLREIGALTLCAGVILSGSLVNANNIEEQNQLSVTIQDTEEFELPKVGIHIPGGIPISDVQHMVYFKVVDADTGLPLQEIRSFEWYIPTFVAYTIEPTTKRLKISYRLAQWDGGIDGQWFNVTELREMEVELNRKGINNSTDNWTNLKIERDNTDAFEIHILKNVSAEEIGGSKNNYLQSITLGEGKLEPEFTKENTQYTLQVNKDTKYLAIYPKAEDPKAEVDEEIVTPLSLGKNHITITVTAENTKQRQYYIDIMRGTEEDKRLEEEKDKLEKESAKVSSSGRYNTDRDLSRFSKVTHVATKVSMDGSMIANSGMKTQEIIPLLSEQQKEQILERFIQKVPYTSLGYTVKVDDMKIATQNMFTDDQIKELIASSEMMAQLGININELVTTVRLQTTGGVVYSDIEENEDIKTAIDEAIGLGILEASKDGSFYPNSNIKYEEALKIMDKLLLIHQIETMKLGRSTINLYFKNVNMAEHPYVGSIASKLQIKTLKNLADKQLGETLTRQELAQIIYEVTENKLVLNHDDVHIGDIQDNSYEPALIYAVQAGLMELDGENISPAKAVTKGEMVQVLMKLNKAIKTQKEAEAKAKIEAAQNITSPEQDPLAVKAGTSTNTDQTSSGQDQFNRRTAE